MKKVKDSVSWLAEAAGQEPIYRAQLTRAEEKALSRAYEIVDNLNMLVNKAEEVDNYVHEAAVGLRSIIRDYAR